MGVYPLEKYISIPRLLLCRFIDKRQLNLFWLEAHGSPVTFFILFCPLSLFWKSCFVKIQLDGFQMTEL